MMHDRQLPDDHAGLVDEINAGHSAADAQRTDAGQSADDTHGRIADMTPEVEKRVETIATIRESWRDRTDLHKAEKALTNQIKARCRRFAHGDVTEAGLIYKAMIGTKGAEHELGTFARVRNETFLEARSIIHVRRSAVEKELVPLAETLPGADWVKDTRGMGMILFAGIIGEAGDLCLYSTPSRVWKRFGLAVMPDGTRQRRVKGAEALEHGYSPQRRSLVWNIGEVMVKTGGEGEGEYRRIYLDRKGYEAAKAEDAGLIVLPAAKLKGKTKDELAAFRSVGHVHARAKRVMEKRVLLDLWRVWRRHDGLSYSAK